MAVICEFCGKQGKKVEFVAYVFDVCLTVNTVLWQVSDGEVVACIIVNVSIFPFEFSALKNFQIPSAGFLTVNEFVRFPMIPHCN